MKKDTGVFFFRSMLRAPRSTGFTLVEVLVAISIFMVAIVALVVVSAQSISNTAYAKNQLTASYLAEEGIELVRSARDDEVSLGGWSGFLSSTAYSACSGSLGCMIEPSASSLITPIGNITVCQSPFCAPFYYDTRTGFYNYDTSGDPTLFTRTITIDDNGGTLDPQKEVRVTSKVSWPEGLVTQTVSMTENLYNWRTAP